MNETVSEPGKRGPGRPRKNPVEREAPRTARRWNMRAGANWESFDASEQETPDRLRIDKGLIPEGMDLQWVTDSVFGQAMPQHRQRFERTGWTPVHQEDFDGRFDGMFMPRGAKGEINVEGLVLMARPQELSIKAKRRDARDATEAVLIKERQLRGGDLPISLDASHPSAIKSNRIGKSMERITVPED